MASSIRVEINDYLTLETADPDLIKEWKVLDQDKSNTITLDDFKNASIVESREVRRTKMWKAVTTAMGKSGIFKDPSLSSKLLEEFQKLHQKTKDKNFQTICPDRAKDTLFQVSFPSSVEQAGYVGVKNLLDIKRQWRVNFGLGTFDGLAGEGVLKDKIFYQADETGNVTRLSSKTNTTPWMLVTPYTADQTQQTKRGFNTLEDLQNYLKKHFIHDESITSAFKIQGDFSVLKIRTVPKQNFPYRPINEIMKHDQTLFGFQDISGTLIGYWDPKFKENIGNEGWHFHFVSEDENIAGHVLELAINQSKVTRISIDQTCYLHIYVGKNYQRPMLSKS